MGAYARERDKKTILTFGSTNIHVRKSVATLRRLSHTRSRDIFDQVDRCTLYILRDVVTAPKLGILTTHILMNERKEIKPQQTDIHTTRNKKHTIQRKMDDLEHFHSQSALRWYFGIFLFSSFFSVECKGSLASSHSSPSSSSPCKLEQNQMPNGIQKERSG